MKLIVGNWKMYPKTLMEAKAILGALKKNARKSTRTKVVICPPALFAHPLLQAAGKTSGLTVGVQNSFWEDEGARTGEISPAQIASLGLSHVILGHSERRALGETDKIVAQKAIQAGKNKLTIILCVGEASRDDSGAYFGEVREELHKSLEGFPKNDAARLVVAYEPIWAIGVKALRPATPHDFHEMSILIRRELTLLFGKTAAFKVPILYGGSVDDRNALGFMKDAGADGLLVGRVSLDPEKFGSIIQLANTLK